eukprot:Ihof_evm5s220 gene=Ihof_evmTU5s220
MRGAMAQLLACLAIIVVPVFASTQEHTHEWAVKFKRGKRSFNEQAEELAVTFNLHNLGTIAGFEDTYSFIPKSRCGDMDGSVCRTRRDSTDQHYDIKDYLGNHPDVAWSEQQKILPRSRRVGLPFKDPDQQTAKDEINGQSYAEISFNDPYYSKQWHFHNKGNDIRVMNLWRKGITGKGVVITVVDDGVEHNHPDLIDNYDPEASYDLTSNDKDPMPAYTDDNINKHGTRCAGQIAAKANNNECGVGVAYESKIGGIRMIDTLVTDIVEARALGFNPNYIDIYSSSWGPDDDGKSLEGPGPLLQAVMDRGIASGRKGKGSIYVFAAGNGKKQDNCNCDGYTNSIYTLSIGAIDPDNAWPWYAEPCSATIAVSYSSGHSMQITTTDLRHKCTEQHTGTSAAAPLVAGIIALLLEVNPNLTWRDVQHLIIATAWKVSPTEDSWFKNGAGKWVSHHFGFGAVDSAALVEGSRKWQTVGPQIRYNTTVHTVNLLIDDAANPVITHITVTEEASHVKYLEHVTVTVVIEHDRRGDLEIYLTSPSGTRSQLLTQRPSDYSLKGFQNWTFMTILCWGESPVGDWTLEVADSVKNDNIGQLVSWQPTFYGTEFPCLHNESCSQSESLIKPTSVKEKEGIQPTRKPQVTISKPNDKDGQLIETTTTSVVGTHGKGNKVNITHTVVWEPFPDDVYSFSHQYIGLLVIFGLVLFFAIVGVTCMITCAIRKCCCRPSKPAASDFLKLEDVDISIEENIFDDRDFSN